MKEADMTLSLGTQVFNLLKKDKRFEVYITRDKNGYTKEFSDYLNNEKENIIAFRNNAKNSFSQEIASGTVLKKKSSVSHINVTDEVSIDLYGFNKWADENKMDAVIHFHFNDYPRPNKWTIGKYTGFTVYMPDKQMPNATESDKLAKNIFKQMHTKYSTSTYKKEAGGLITDQSLIALGANGTLDKNVLSVLTEYGYIYQKIFRTSASRLKAYKTMASLTTKGILNYFYPAKK